jgi:hypothetical protein
VKLSRERKVFAGILVLAVAGLALDRLYLGVTGPDAVSASPDVQPASAQSTGSDTPSPRRPTLAGHLRSIRLPVELGADCPDAFSGHHDWLPQGTTSARGAGSSEPRFLLPELRLTAIIGTGQRATGDRDSVVLAAVINNQTVPIGGMFDGFQLREIGERWVVVSDATRFYRVSLPDSAIEVLEPGPAAESTVTTGR